MTAIKSLLQGVGQMARGCPDPTLINAYRDAARQFCTESRWLRREIPGVTVAETATYLLGSDDDLEVIGIRALSITGDGKVSAFGPSDPTQWDANRTSDRPSTYTYTPEAQFTLFPTPDKVYTVKVTAQCTPTRTTTDLPDDLLGKWDRVLRDGALAYVLKIAGKAWTNPGLARTFEIAFHAGINNAKADEQRGHNTGTVRMQAPRVMWGNR